MTAVVGVVVFPGSNCELDVVEAVDRPRRRGPAACGTATTRSATSTRSWCPAASPTATTCAPAPSPASRRSWRAVGDFAAAGGPVVGICNGFQVLTEAGLLPGALQKNRGPQVPVHDACELRVETDRHRRSPAASTVGTVLRIPINHFEGNYTCSPETLAELRADDRVVLRYVDNPNGSVDDIAGICNGEAQRRRPHAAPRAGVATPLLGSTDGVPLLRSLLVTAGALDRLTGTAPAGGPTGAQPGAMPACLSTPAGDAQPRATRRR